MGSKNCSELVSKSSILNAIKNFKRGRFLNKERKLLAIFMVDRRFSVELSPPPEPEVNLSYIISKEEETFLNQLGKDIELIHGLFAEIAEAIYIQNAIVQEKKKRKILYPRKNVTTETNKDFEIPSENVQKFKVRAYQPNKIKLNEKIHSLIAGMVEKKYGVALSTERKKLQRYHKYSKKIYGELISNRFIDDGGDPLVSLRDIQGYLHQRVKKEPRKIRCAWCNRTTYVFRKNKNKYCYRESCKVSTSRKASNPTYKNRLL